MCLFVSLLHGVVKNPHEEFVSLADELTLGRLSLPYQDKVLIMPTTDDVNNAGITLLLSGNLEIQDSCGAKRVTIAISLTLLCRFAL